MKPLKGHTDIVAYVSCSQDGIQVVSSSDVTIRIWNAKTGEEVMKINRGGILCPSGRCFESYSDRMSCVGLSPDSTHIVSGSVDKTLRIWDATTGKEVMKLGGHSDRIISVGFSSYGTRVVSGSLDKKIQIWDAKTVQERDTRTLLLDSDGWIRDSHRKLILWVLPEWQTCILVIGAGVYLDPWRHFHVSLIVNQNNSDPILGSQEKPGTKPQQSRRSTI